MQRVGFQGHCHDHWQRRTPEQLMGVLDRFADLGVTLQVTEFDTSGRWPEDRSLRERRGEGEDEMSQSVTLDADGSVVTLRW